MSMAQKDFHHEIEVIRTASESLGLALLDLAVLRDWQRDIYLGDKLDFRQITIVRSCSQEISSVMSKLSYLKDEISNPGSDDENGK